VPALEVDGQAIFDSTIILEYLEDRWPTPALLPVAPLARAQARMIEDVCDTYYEAINWAIAEILVFGRATGALAEKLLGRAAEQTRGVNAWLSERLGKGPWFGGATFGWADLSVAPHVNAAANFGNAGRGRTPLAAWLERLRARPSAQRTSSATPWRRSATSPTCRSRSRAASSSGLYRDHRLEWMIRSGGVEVVPRRPRQADDPLLARAVLSRSRIRPRRSPHCWRWRRIWIALSSTLCWLVLIVSSGLFGAS
jgi:glutathione S-transferase